MFVLTLLATPLAAQSRTEDGIRAILFMAGLYEVGRGVPVDPVRACALYLRASVDLDNPFGRAAAALHAASTGRGREFGESCQLLAIVGFDHGFQAATFHLGPGHFVQWTLSAATVTYEGRTKRSEVVYAPPGARFLPLQYTELPVGPTRSLTRHFVEMFLWEPAGRSGPWKLRWQLFEVVRDEIIRIDTPESLATVEGDAPPPREAFDVREFAGVRVDHDGNTEWAVLKGAHPRTQRIESEDERREVRDERRARAAALKGVDWNQRFDVHRVPAMTYVDADGCGSVQLYGWTADRAEAIAVRITARDLGLVAQPATFDLSGQFVNILVEAHVYDAPQRQFDFCSDVRTPLGLNGAKPEAWRAIAGTVTIELSPPGVRAHAPYLRRATVILNNVILRNAAGQTVAVPQPVRLTAIAGSMGG